MLGLLIERPGYGYDLFHRFERTYGEALVLTSPSQVYGALKPLKQKALIEQLPRDDDDVAAELSQPKPRYRATVAGRCHYREWLVAQACEKRQSLELLTLLVALLTPARCAPRWSTATSATCSRSARARRRSPTNPPRSPAGWPTTQSSWKRGWP